MTRTINRIQPKWQQRDDSYQVGQLIAMLLRGDVTSPMRSRDVRRLPCSDHLKEVIHRCLGALMEIRRLAAQGHRIIIIGEAQFWRLARARARGKSARSRRAPSHRTRGQG